MVGYLVALASTDLFARSTTKLMGKHPNGRIHLLSWLLLLPYHAGMRVKVGIQRLVSDEPLYNRVLSGWYIGGWPRAAGELPPDGPSVLDCTCELPRTHRSRYLCLPIWDTQAPSVSQVDRGVAFAMAERSLGRPVYVHCAHGHGRSALLLLACLLEARQVGSCEEGLALLQAVRPRVRLNARQRLALEAWACSRGLSSGGAGGATSGLANGGASGALQMHALTPASCAGLGSGGGGGGGSGGVGMSGGAGSGGGAVRLVAEANGHGGAAVAVGASGAVVGVGAHGLEARITGQAVAVGHAAAAMGHGAGHHIEVAAGLGEGGKKLS
ncbi:hypothetical protein GPECTOR_25g331 [Gonium pectorale]|uniref:Tyrosine specific protein phosphatases domain-containing protein n=1 Tax=Gonium pectorale TaxID=33097 RepID=A0A150GFW8_GONPE|nr:hypothetical protein GPECTOR_25g331 [Gonium pectorale]|eukprot:KXZ48747.1 hypothetical protein GPECTOR_25g331 [Gonium pectorale]